MCVTLWTENNIYQGKSLLYKLCAGENHILSIASKWSLSMGAAFIKCGFQGSTSPALLSSCMIEVSFLPNSVVSIFITGRKQIQKQQVKFLSALTAQKNCCVYFTQFTVVSCSWAWLSESSDEELHFEHCICFNIQK